MNKQLLGTFLALPILISPAFAQDNVFQSVKTTGFGTGALTWSSTDDAEFGRPEQGTGVGKNPRTGVDSNLGLQVDAQLNDWLSLTGQGLVRKAGQDSYGAEAMMALAKLKLSDAVSVRVGRLPFTVFLISDFRNVGYANTTIRPSQEVYWQVPISTLDGADVSWKHDVGTTSVTTQFAYGRATGKVGGDGRMTMTGSSVLNLIVEQGPLTLRFGRNDGELSLKSTYFVLPKTKVSFTAVGMSLDLNNVVAQSEYTQARGVGPRADAWYVMGGYRFGKLLPFYQHSKLTGDFRQTTDSVGVRWDAFRSAAIKFQLDHVNPDGGGILVNVKPGFRGPVTVGAVALDFVF